MAAAKKPSPKCKAVVPDEIVYPCTFCKKDFRSEGVFLKHMCLRKARYMDRDEKYVKLGFWAYQRFYSISYNTKKPPTFEAFSRSQFYIVFTKFARYLLDINAVNPEAFVDFLIKNGLPVDRWNSPTFYETYLREMVKRESADAALERNFLLMEKWAVETGDEWTDFFRKVSPALAVLWIRSGRISPWILYTATSATEFFERLSNEQHDLIEEALDPEFWQVKLSQNAGEVAVIRETLMAAGI